MPAILGRVTSVACRVVFEALNSSFILYFNFNISKIFRTPGRDFCIVLLMWLHLNRKVNIRSCASLVTDSWLVYVLSVVDALDHLKSSAVFDKSHCKGVVLSALYLMLLRTSSLRITLGSKP